MRAFHVFLGGRLIFDINTPNLMWIKTTLRTLAVLLFSAPVFAQGDCSYELNCPESALISCTDQNSPDESGWPEIITDCDTADLVITWTDSSEGDECLTVITRVFAVSLNGEELATCEQIVSVIDDQAPTFPNLPEDLVILCGEELPEVPECPAVDDCSGVLSCETFVAQTGSAVDSCDLSTPVGPGPDWSVWLPGLPISSPHFLWDGEPNMVTYFNGTAHITGLVRNADDANLAFEVDMWLQNARNWTDWSDLGRSYKDDYAMVGDNYLDWTYYEMVDVFSRLIGTDGLEGSELELYHMPSDFFYGFQCGVGGNNRNMNEGLSGWFTFSGEFDGEDVEGHGDLATDKSCTPIEVNADCDSNAGYTYYWRATDNCGNTATASQSVASQDLEAPEFVSFPDDVTITCTQLPYESIAPVAEDACPGQVSLYGPEDNIIEAECPVAYIIERAWEAVDLCGNTVRRVQLISVIDEGDPYFIDVPEIVELSCVAEMGVIYAEAEDDCSEVTITYDDIELEDEQYCGGSVERTYTATDICGNTATATQLILVVDEETPVFTSFPEDLSVSCDNVPAVDDSAIQYSDNCPDLEFVVEQEQIEGDCPGNYTLIREYRVIDVCGNTASQTWTIQVSDTSAPQLFGVPTDIDLTCGDPFPDALVFATDNCDDAPVVSATAETELLECGYIFIRTWTAVDACGNESSASQTITLSDNNNPVFVSFPADTTITCSDIPYESEVPEVEDDCLGEVNLSYTDEILPGECPVAYYISRSWAAVDGCGNESRQAQTITVIDDQNPIFISVPEIIELSCSAETDEIYAEATDDCSELEITFEDEELDDEQYCNGSVLRTYTATDICGNSVTASQMILVVDEETPVITAFPEDITVSCGNIPEIYPSSIQYSDNCPEPELLLDQSQIETDCPGNYTLIREYRVIDACGNTATQTWTIQVVDDEAPELFGVPADIVLNCDENIPDAIVFAVDNCDDQPIVALTAETEELECGQLFIRTWTATDACGNSYSESQEVSIIDNEGPEFVVFPDDITVQCGEEIPASEVEVDDSCSEVVSFESEESTEDGECAAEYTLYRTYTATDGCGNTSIRTQIISIVDTEGPVFNDFSAEIEVSCDLSFPEDFGVSAEDNCSSVELTFEDSAEDFECGQSYTRTWTATDACGNTSTAVQTLEAVDNEPPVVLTFPEDITVNCDAYNPNAPVVFNVVDNCASEISMIMTDFIVEGDCPNNFQRVRTYTWADGCDNATSRTYTVNVVDVTPPSLLGVPADVSISCLDPIPDAIVFATDNCTDLLEVSLSATTNQLECGYEFIRTWSTVDECGNEASATQTITVVDDTDPYFDSLPEDLFLTCGDSIPPIAEVVVLDDCDDAPILFVVDEYSGTECPFTITRIFRAADCAGNYAIYAQYIYFEETPGIAGENGPSIDWNISRTQSEEYTIALRSSINTRCSIEILSLNGKRLEGIQELNVEAGSESTVRYNTSGIASGIYLIRVYSNEMSETRKVAIVR